MALYGSIFLIYTAPDDFDADPNPAFDFDADPDLVHNMERICNTAFFTFAYNPFFDKRTTYCNT